MTAGCRYPYAIPPERQRSMIDLRVTDDYKVNQRRSMAVGPYEDLPPHLRNHLVRFSRHFWAERNSGVFVCMEICKNHLLSSDSTSGFDQMLALLMFAQSRKRKSCTECHMLHFSHGFITKVSPQLHCDQSPSERTKANLKVVYLYYRV